MEEDHIMFSSSDLGSDSFALGLRYGADPVIAQAAKHCMLEFKIP